MTRASETLHVSQPTVSGQLRELQEALGEKLLVRAGRTVVLTDVGRTVYRYADEIFALGRELQQAVKGRVTQPARLAVGAAMVVPKLVAYQILEPALHLPEAIQLDCVHERPERLVAELAIFALDRDLLAAVKGRPTRPGRLAVGVAMVVPKLVAYQILEPALHLPEPIQLDCVHERPERLVAELAVYSLDVVLADTPAPPAVKVRAYIHLLGECGVSIFGTERLAATHRRRFPRSLDGAPFLLPSGASGLRLSLEDWFRKQGIRPRVVGTFEDSATFGYAIIHLVDVVLQKMRSNKTWVEYLLDRDSLVPNMNDLREAAQTVRWFIGMGPRPAYGRWTYWEKFDYFAVFWGIFVIGSTGLILWFAEFFTRLLPGQFINVATIIHSDEALLATGFIFTVHFFNTHLRPEKFPMDTVVFTGYMPLEEFMLDKPAEYEELVRTGKLNDHLVVPYPTIVTRTIRGFAWSALTVGFGMVVWMDWGLAKVAGASGGDEPAAATGAVGAVSFGAKTGGSSRTVHSRSSRPRGQLTSTRNVTNGSPTGAAELTSRTLRPSLPLPTRYATESR